MNRVETRRHLLAVLPSFMFCIVIFVVFLITSLLLYVWIAPDAVFLHLASNIVALLAGGTFIHDYFSWRFFVVIVTRQRIIVRRGVLLRYSCSYDLTGTEVDCEQNVLSSLVDMGDLIVRSPHISSDIRIPSLADFKAIRRVLES